MLTHLLLLASLLLQSAADPKQPDWIRLDDGKTMKGRVVYDGPDAVRIRRGAGEVEVERARIAELRSIEESLEELLDAFGSAAKDDPGALGELARFAAERDLVHEAANLWLRVLLLDPANEEAVEGAGARRIRDQTRMQGGRGWIDLDEYASAKPRWKDALELRTAHFTVVSDLPLADILDFALRAEKHYLRFYGFLGPKLGLYVFDEVPEIRIYAGEDGFPTAWRSTGARSWFAPGENVLHARAGEGLNLTQVFHDATDLLLFNAFRRSSGRTGQIPAWAVEGFSQYFAATAGARPEDAWGELGTPFAQLFAAVARDEEPVPVQALLRATHHEFRGGDDARRMSAHAYILVHYLLHGDGGSHREEFLGLLREAWSGKSIEKRLVKTVGGTPDALQKAMVAYARTPAR